MGDKNIPSPNLMSITGMLCTLEHSGDEKRISARGCEQFPNEDRASDVQASDVQASDVQAGNFHWPETPDIQASKKNALWRWGK